MRGKRLGVVLASTAAGLAMCEAALRLSSFFGPNRVAASVLTLENLSDMERAETYAARLTTTPGTHREWFAEDPPPLANRTTPAPGRAALHQDYARRGLYGPEAEYLWNRQFVELERCSPNSHFRNYPDHLVVFDPPTGSDRPRFRFPPNSTSAAGLVTNEFGLRGHPLTLAKPPRTVRIAFLGASTTVGVHKNAFSFPERVEFWLNRYAETNGLDVRFEALNAGREGLNSLDSARILQDELLPLDPDLAVFYEGANHFPLANDLVEPHIPPRQKIDPREPIVQHSVPDPVRAHLALGELTDRALNRFHSAGEPRKPAYRLKWPAGVDERNPNPDDPNLPLELPKIVANLDAMRRSLGGTGGRLVVCSYVWLAEEGMPLSPVRHKYIYEQLNTVLWPLRYGDIRRLADFQNRVFRNYARARNLDFLDVAAASPRDLNLFMDAIHVTKTGDRLRGWIVFQQLAPVLRRLIESGALPHRSPPAGLPQPPPLAASETTTRCGDPPSPALVRIDDALSLDNLAQAYDGAQIDYGRPMQVTTADLPASYAAQIPFHIPAGLPGPYYVHLRGRALAGRIGVGVLETVNGRHGDPRQQKYLTPEMGALDLYIPLLAPDRADMLILTNAVEGRMRSRALVDDASLMAFSKPPVERVAHVVDLKAMQPGEKASVDRAKVGVMVTARPLRSSRAAHLPIALTEAAGAGLTAHLRVRVLAGSLGFGLVSAEGKPLAQPRSVWASQRLTEVVLPLPSHPPYGELVVWNTARTDIASRAAIESVEIHKAQ